MFVNNKFMSLVRGIMRKQNIYIGNCSKNGIYQYQLKNGKLIKQYKTNDFERCTYLANNNSYVYGVIELQSEKENGYIVSYKKDRCKLINIDKASSYGQGPCHIEINHKLQLMFISNYIDGNFTVLKINENGTIGKKIYSNIENKQKSHVHCAKTSIDSKFLFVTDLGIDTIIAYEIYENKIREISRVKLKDNTQPRHIAVSKDRIYVITEKSCEIYTLELINKKLKIINVTSIIPENVKAREDFTGCAIKISKNYKNIYVTIRGSNTISAYKIKGDNLKEIQNVSCMGELPRDLEIDQYGKNVLIANQNSNEITIFRRNRITGKLKYKNKEQIESPTCIIVDRGK